MKITNIFNTAREIGLVLKHLIPEHGASRRLQAAVANYLNTKP